MTNSKTTRKALLSSALALTMCVAMLIATTFAWFTDTASTSVNKIQAGTLKVGLQMKNADGNWVDAEGTTLNFKKASTASGTEILWEPGCTYELPAIRVINEGNLAFKYKLVVSGAIGDTKLLDAIEFTVTDSNNSTTNLTDMTGIIIPKGMAPANDNEKVQYSNENGITIKGHMKEEAGNEYKGLTVSGISITVYATQYTYEYDSYNNTYDKVDLWDGTVATADELKAVTNDTNKTVAINSAKLLAAFAEAVNNGSTSHITTENGRNLAYQDYTITLTEDINLAGVSWTPIGNATYSFAGTFDGNNHTISGLAINAVDGVKDVGLIGYARHATIKNLTVSDAKVSDVGRLGVILGKGEQENIIQNCTVKDSTITARTWWDPSENGGAGGYNDGDKAGAIAGYLCEGGNVVTGCTVTNCTITGYREIGGLIGYINGVDHSTYGEGYKDSVTGNTVANTTITWDKTHDYKSGTAGYDTEEGYNVNAIVGKIADPDWNGVTGNTETKVTIIEKTS